MKKLILLIPLLLGLTLPSVPDHGVLPGLAGQGVGGGADDHGLGSNDSPTWTGATFSGLSVSSIIASDASKALESVTIGSSLDYSRPTLDAIQDIRTTASPTFVGLTLSGKVTSGSFASPVDVTVAGQYGFELHYSGNNYDVTGIRSRARLKTTDTTATAQGALLQAANEDGINAGVLNGALIEAIGKSTANAATISTMRGALIGTEWGALDTVTNLKTLHVRNHSRNAAGAGSFGTGYGIYIENEAVGGNGQAYDAGIYFKGTNLSAGNKAFTYGIDFSGATYGTAEIKLSNGETISNLTDGQIDLTGATTTGDGGITNYTYIDSGGRILLKGTAQTWEDLRIIPGAFQFPGTADPTLESWQPGGSGATYKVYKFKKNDEVHFTCQLPHAYKEGSDIKPHIHWTPCDRGNEENGKTVGWKIDYSWANVDATFGASATIDLSHACSGTDDQHELTASGTITGTAKVISSILVIRLYRSDDGADDTWVGATAALSPAILEFDLHYEVDGLGSDLELVKDAP